MNVRTEVTAVTMENALILWGQVYQEDNVSVILDSLERSAVKVSLRVPTGRDLCV